MGRSPSTISRTLRRIAATRSGGFEYRATTAQWHAARAGRRPRPTRLERHADLRRYVEDRLAEKIAYPVGHPLPDGRMRGMLPKGGTLVERTARFTMLLRLPPMPAHRKGPCFMNEPALAGRSAEAVRVAIVATIATLPAHPRRSLTKGTDLAAHGPDERDAVVAALNGRPRKTLDRRTPAEALDGLLDEIQMPVLPRPGKAA